MARARRSKSAGAGTPEKSQAASTAASQSRSAASADGEFKCPECGRTFTRAASLGAHRRRAHGVAGAASTKKSTRTGTTRRRGAGSRRRTTSATPASATRARSTASNGRDGAKVDRNALLAALFPNGIPPREEVIQAANRWLDDAEQLTRMR
jgi:uncharacterized C2H2 Zn-finger protein